MADKKVSTRFAGGMTFQSHFDDGHHILIDTSEADGGNDLGPRPKQLMLSALAGCTGIDVVSMLNKMRVPFNNFSIDIEANLTKETPKIYDWVKVIYSISVKQEDEDKVRRAVKMSKEQYCGVSAMFEKFATVESEIVFL
jgi:putative redox protein